MPTLSSLLPGKVAVAASCDRCHLALEPGALRFDASLKLCGSTGGALDPAAARALHTPGTSALEEALRQAEQFTEAELMETVVEEFRFTLCPACRNVLRADPASAATMRQPASGGPQ